MAASSERLSPVSILGLSSPLPPPYTLPLSFDPSPPACRRVVEIETSREKKIFTALPSQRAHCLSFSIAMRGRRGSFQNQESPLLSLPCAPLFHPLQRRQSFTLLPLVRSPLRPAGILLFVDICTRYPRRRSVSRS